jgi:hypothetical protein
MSSLFLPRLGDTASSWRCRDLGLLCYRLFGKIGVALGARSHHRGLRRHRTTDAAQAASAAVEESQAVDLGVSPEA